MRIAAVKKVQIWHFELLRAAPIGRKRHGRALGHRGLTLSASRATRRSRERLGIDIEAFWNWDVSTCLLGGGRSSGRDDVSVAVDAEIKFHATENACARETVTIDGPDGRYVLIAGP